MACWWHELYSGDEPRIPLPEKSQKIRVLHVVKWFYAGGAERLLTAILEHSDKNKYEHVVLSLSDQNERIQEIQDTLGIPYVAMHMHRNKYNIANYIRCLRFILKVKPDVMKTWLPPSNISGGIMGKLLGIPVIWGIHDAQPPTVSDALKQRSISDYIPTRIVCCSQPVYDTCVASGYNPDKLEVIINGTDVDAFNYRLEGRKKIRKELGIGEHTVLIGMAAEFIPMKRHHHFLAAANRLL